MPSNRKRLTLLIFKDVHPIYLKSRTISTVMTEQGNEPLRVGLNVKRIIIFKRGENLLDGTYIRVPWFQRSDFARRLLKYLKKSGIEVGAYSASEDAPTYGMVRTNELQCSKNGKEIYEVIVRSDKVVQKVIEFLKPRYNARKIRNKEFVKDSGTPESIQSKD